MPNMLFANNCNTTLNGGITAIATSMVVTSATGFPSPTGSQYFYCTLADAATQTTIEIVKVTAVSGTTFTIVRGQDGTSGTIFASGAVVSLRLVRANLNDFPKLDEANTFTQAQTFSALTSGRVPYSTTGGLQTDSANLTFDGTNLKTGAGGTGATSSYFAIDGSSATNYGSYLAFRRNGSDKNYIGQLSAVTASNANDMLLWANGAWNIQFYTNGAQAQTIFSSGGVSIGNTTDPGAGVLFVSSGVRFPATQVASADANTLDDYEEGTWTPNFSAWTTTPATYGVWATYTKIGRQVFIQLRGYGGTNTNGIAITGLPFTPSELPYGTGLAVGSDSSAGFRGTFTSSGLVISSNAAPYWWGFSGTYFV